MRQRPEKRRKAEEPTRQETGERFDVLSPRFMQWMARLAKYGVDKYGDFNFAKGVLEGDKSPENHIQQHLCKYLRGEKYDHFDGDRRWHLVAIAFNAMMKFFEHSKWGWRAHPLEPEDKGDFDAPADKAA